MAIGFVSSPRRACAFNALSRQEEVRKIASTFSIITSHSIKKLTHGEAGIASFKQYLSEQMIKCVGKQKDRIDCYGIK
jgi:hypothetical protein